MPATTVPCVGCGAQIDAAARLCPECGTSVAISSRLARKLWLGKRRLLFTVIAMLAIGFAIDALIDKEHGKPLPHPHQLLDAPQ